MPHLYQLPIAALATAAAGAVVKYSLEYGFGVIKFFTRMDTKIDLLGVDMTSIHSNHLPHIYGRLGTLEERLEIRQDKTGDFRGDRKDGLDIGLDPR